MTVTISEINKVWRLTNENINSPVYDQTTVSGIIDECVNDLYWAASEIWFEKAAVLQSTDYNYSTEGESFSLNQRITNALNLANRFASKRKATSALWVKDPVDNLYDGLFSGDLDDFLLVVNETDPVLG